MEQMKKRLLSGNHCAKLCIIIQICLFIACKPSNHPRLLFSANDVSVLKMKAESPEGIAIIAQLRRRLAIAPDPLLTGSYAAGHGFLYLLFGQEEDRQASMDYTEKVLRDEIPYISTQEEFIDKPMPLWNSNFKAIYRAQPILSIALAYDICFNFWPDDFRTKVAMELEDKLKKLLNGGGVGWNENPWSNWHGITKGAGGVAALAILGDKGISNDIDAYIDKARKELLLHLSYLGDKGWTPEGFDYLRFELCSGVLPFVQCYKQVKGIDLSDSASNIQWFMPFYVMQSVVHDKGVIKVPDYGPCGVDWNTNRWRSGDFVMGMGVSDKKYIPAILWTFNKAFGLQGDSTFNIFKPHDAIFALVNYPQNIISKNPSTVLSHVWIDEKAGTCIIRNHWQDENDIVFAVTGNALARRASHSHREAGSFRLLGLGSTWASRGIKTPKVRNEFLENTVLVDKATNWRGTAIESFSIDSSADLKVVLRYNMKEVYVGGNGVAESIYVGVDKASRTFIVHLNDSSAKITIADSITGGGERLWKMHGRVKFVVRENKNVQAINQNGNQCLVEFPVDCKLLISVDSTCIKAKGKNNFVVNIALY